MGWRSVAGVCAFAGALACGAAFSQPANEASSAMPGAAAESFAAGPVSSQSPPGAETPVTTTFVSLGRHGQGLLWAPAARGGAARTGVVLVHPFATSLGHVLCRGLAARGFLALCADPPETNRPFRFAGYDAQAQTIGSAIRRLREEEDLRSVFLAGHGEGGALAAFYQNVAQNGPSACLGPEKIAPCAAARLTGLPPAAGLVLIDPDLGQAFATLSSLDPAIAVERAPTQRYPDLDMYDPRNGFDPGRNAADYPPAFRKSFHAAQAERNARLTAEARKLVSAVAARDRDAFADDMPLFVAGALTTPLWQVDSSLLARSRKPHKLLAADGATQRRVLETIALPSGNPREAFSHRTAVPFTALQFLAGHAIETTPAYDVTADDVTGVVWASSATSAIPNIAGVHQPVLIMVMTASFAARPAEMILDAAASSDKELVGVEGATHALTPCSACAGARGRGFGDTKRRTLDYVAEWLRRRS